MINEPFLTKGRSIFAYGLSNLGWVGGLKNTGRANYTVIIIRTPNKLPFLFDFLVKTNLGQFHSSNLDFWQLLNPGQKHICKNQRYTLKHIILSPKVYVFSSCICAN